MLPPTVAPARSPKPLGVPVRAPNADALGGPRSAPPRSCGVPPPATRTSGSRDTRRASFSRPPAPRVRRCHAVGSGEDRLYLYLLTGIAGKIRIEPRGARRT